MRTIYIRPDAVPPELKSCCVVGVPPLLRELILAVVHMPIDYDDDGRDGLVVRLLLQEMKPLPLVPLHLPMPNDRRLARICTGSWRIHLTKPRSSPGAGRSVRANAPSSGCFRKKLASPTACWKQQARLMSAVRLLAEGKHVTDISLQLGYESPSAFSAMFRRALGMTPTEYFREAPRAEHSG